MYLLWFAGRGVCVCGPQAHSHNLLAITFLSHNCPPSPRPNPPFRTFSISLGSPTSFNSQPTFVVQHKDAEGKPYFIYMADNWVHGGPAGLIDASYIWLPMQFFPNNGKTVGDRPISIVPFFRCVRFCDYLSSLTSFNPWCCLARHLSGLLLRVALLVICLVCPSLSFLFGLSAVWASDGLPSTDLPIYSDDRLAR